MSQVTEHKGSQIFGKIMLALISLCIFAAFGLTLLWQLAGLMPIYTGAIYYIGLATVAFALIWAIYGITNKCRSGAMKFAVGTLLGFAGAVVLLFAYAGVQSFLIHDGEMHAVIKNPEGENGVVVIEGYYEDEERFVSRHGEDYQDKLQPDDYMRDYRVYRLVGGIFMDASPVREEMDHIYIGEDSEATLMYEWLDEKTLRFYIENPEEDDRGEIVLTFE